MENNICSSLKLISILNLHSDIVTARNKMLNSDSLAPFQRARVNQLDKDSLRFSEDQVQEDTM